MSVPSEKETELIQQLRGRVGDIELREEQLADWNLVRWLRARDMNLDEAEDMLRKSIAWREQNGMDQIQDWHLPNYLAENFPLEIVGNDKEGSPIMVVPVGHWKLSEAVSCGENMLFIKYCMKMLENLTDLMNTQSEGKEKPITQFIVIYDFEDFPINQLASIECIETVLDAAAVFDLNFPETLKACYCVNVPKAFSVLYGIIKPALTDHTLAKLEVYGNNAGKWKSALLKKIPATQLPPKFGGTNISCVKEFLYGIQIDDEDSDEMISKTIEAGKKLELQQTIEEKNSFMSWTFRTDLFDIGFKVLNGSGEELLNFQKVNSHQEIMNGSLVCEEPGDYTIIFDNSYSLLRSKKVHYIINVNTPSEIITILKD